MISERERELDMIKSIPIKLLNPVRTGSKLLVLDLDFTLWDGHAQVDELTKKLRPGLFDFLHKVVEFYDLIIWSNTSHRFLMTKLQALGLLIEHLIAGAFGCTDL